MFNSSIFYLLFTVILLILLLLYYLYKTNVTRQIKKYLQNSGISTKAEILGYYKDNSNNESYYSDTYSLPQYLAILKFYDENGMEHIILDTFNKNITMKYTVGNTIDIKYIKTDLISDTDLRSKIYKLKTPIDIWVGKKNPLYDNYFHKLNKLIVPTDTNSVYTVLLESKRTKLNPFIFILIGFILLIICSFI